MNPTAEQEDILDVVYDEEGDVIVNAYAGTGKTTTLKMIVQDNPDKKFIYLAYNKAVAKEAKKKFPENCFVTTVHGLAYRSFVPTLDQTKFHSKLSNFWKTKDYIKHFNIESLKSLIPPDEDLFVLASDIRSMVQKFKNSDAGILDESFANFGNFREKIYDDSVKSAAVEIANRIWEAEIDMDSPVPMDHNTYLKMWELSEPTIGKFDIVLFDEAQDANPVMLSVVDKLQGVRKVYVGDTYQAIYGWNGAVNAMSMVDVDHVKYLTKSWRFGSVVADEANKILSILSKDPVPLQGNDKIKSVKGEINQEEQYTVIFRTNGSLANFAVRALQDEKTVYVEGGVKELCNDLLALYHLKVGEFHPGMSKYKPYKTFGEVMEEAKVDVVIKRDVAFIEEHGDSTPELLELLKEKTLDKRSIKRANILLTTAHKSKGLEFENVLIWDDFKIFNRNKEDKLKPIQFVEREEVNLLYVAVTRAIKTLSVNPLYEAFIEESLARKGLDSDQI